jgi:hypothetical protein
MTEWWHGFLTACGLAYAIGLLALLAAFSVSYRRGEFADWDRSEYVKFALTIAVWPVGVPVALAWPDPRPQATPYGE